MLATQRLSKLHKDAAAEATNVLVRRTTLDVDLGRARDLLGLSRSSGQELRRLAPGQWYGTGPALSVDEVTRFRAAQVQTTHPQAGSRHLLSPSKPSKKLHRVLAELAASIDSETQEAYTLEEANAEIVWLRAELAKRASARVDEHAIEVAVKQAEIRLREEFERHGRAVADRVEATLRLATEALASLRSGPQDRQSSVQRPASRRPARPSPQKTRRRAESSDAGGGEVPGGGARRMLVVLAQHGAEGCERTQLAILARLSARSGTFSTYLSRLRALGFVEDGGAGLVATDAGVEALGGFPKLPSGEALVDYWLTWCGGGGKRRMLEALVHAGGDGLSREGLATRADLSPESGTFSTYLSSLRATKLVEGSGGRFRASDVLLRSLEAP